MRDPAEFYSMGAEQFAENYTIENLSDEFVDFIDRFIEEVGSGKVLDAGCGPGRDVEYFIENGLDAVGIDLAEGMVEHAKENRKGEYRVMDVKDLKFKDNSFDAVYSNTVLIFLERNEARKAIREFRRVTKPGSIIYLGLKIGEKEVFIREKYGDEVKQYLFTEEGAREMLNNENFEIIDEMKLTTDEEFNFFNLICKKKAE